MVFFSPRTQVLHEALKKGYVAHGAWSVFSTCVSGA